ncbi:MAG TPA: histidine kinase dimerization/phospho-acceptor domain-containing protein [Chitinophagaceae bacterium]|nr:histidine kinase dimerization/phospho-acceptor domain-containing protein [Chitinophagaceae bacterium]
MDTNNGTGHQHETASVSSLEFRIRQLEALLEDKTRQLDEVTRELDDFSFAVSHDLKAPVRALSGFSAILKEEQHDNLDDEGKRVVNVIEANARKLTSMIDEMVTHSSISKKDVVLRQVDMYNAARQSMLNLLTADEAKLFTVTVASLPVCTADEKMMQHVWLNVLNMALLYAGKNGHLSITVDFEEEGDRLTYFVKTVKTVMLPEEQEKLAGILKANIHQHLEGHGAGSAFIKRALHKHTGNFWTQYIPGKESVFFFSLPKR